ncbi:MAG: MMPL family transporter [Candidatus Saccharimonadales bacterium]
MFEAIARFSVRFRWFIIVFWIAAVPILTANLPSITNVSKNDNSSFLPKNSESTKAINMEANFQSKNTSATATIVAVRDSGPLTQADNAAIDSAIVSVKKINGVTTVKNQGVSADGAARQMLVELNGASFGNGAITIVKDIRADLSKNLPSGLTMHLSGSLADSVDTDNANTHGRNNTELYTVIFIIALLLLVFRALLAPIVTLIPAGLALAVSQPIIAESTKWGVQVSFITQILLIVLVLGAGTDYGLFLVFRVREELRKGYDPKEAVVRALTKVGESITFSALTVAAALMSLLLASFGIYKGLGPALAIGLGIMLLIALTFLPAVLAILGRAVFWPSKTQKSKLKIGLWGKLADTVIKRPVTMLLLGVAILGGLSLGIIGYKTTGFSSNGAPSGSDSAKGEQAISAHFPAANNNPQLFLLSFNNSVWNNLSTVQTAQEKLASSGSFKAVSGPFSANGFNITPDKLKALHENNPSSPVLQAVSQFISPDGKTVQFYVISKAGTSGSASSVSATPSNRNLINKVSTEVGASSGAVFSSDSIAYDIEHIATSDLEKIIPVVLIVIAVLLAILLRSLVAPWYLILTVVFSYLASLGFAMILFVHIGNQDGLNFILPFMMFIFVMALGEDYNILVMSRIREESHTEKKMDYAVTKAIGITGTTVTSAGLILAGTFGVLGLVGGNSQIEQIGYSIAFGILLDTFFVRTLLVPSIVALLGRWNWWPSDLYRRVE